MVVAVTPVLPVEEPVPVVLEPLVVSVPDDIPIFPELSLIEPVFVDGDGITGSEVVLFGLSEVPVLSTGLVGAGVGGIFVGSGVGTGVIA